jgi:hypothetical protein
VLVLQPFINGFGIMCSIEQDFIDCAQGEPLRKFNGAYNQTYSVMPGRGWSLGYKGKSCWLFAAESMYKW